MPETPRPDPGLLLAAETRAALWRRLGDVIEHYFDHIAGQRVAPELDPARIRALLKPIDFEKPLEPLAALDFAVRGLWEHQVHPPHPCYYGLFNPATTPMSIVGDALTALFNPQVAAWSHSPFAVEVEQHLMRALAEQFGYDPAQTCGTFCTAGTEANHTAVLAALTHAFSDFATKGVRGLTAQPVAYLPAEGHHSVHRAIRLCGLGSDAIREVPADLLLRMDPVLLADWIEEDRSRGLRPFLISATVGTTNAGIIDPLPDIAEIARREGLWFHVDAAWGGAVALVPEYRCWLTGIQHADSITFDLHKWLQIPMGAGLFLSRHPDILDQTFRMTAAYMPREAAGLPVIDPYTQSIQWTRRFIGLKAFLSLAVAGWSGYQTVIRHTVAMGLKLRHELAVADWAIVNRTPLPIACFVDRRHREGEDQPYVEAVARAVVASGKAWISPTTVGAGRHVLRACITNFRTEPRDIDTLLEALEDARAKLASSGGRI